MVRSLRYWLQAVGLTTEEKHKITTQVPSDLANIIWERDRYIEELGTLCLLHHNLACNIEKATAWYYFFNEFSFYEFDKSDFIDSLSKFASINDNEVAESSYEGDFNCIINTYLSRTKSNPKKLNPEDNIDCPFGELNLIDITDKSKRVYRKVQPSKGTLHPLIMLAILVKQSEGLQKIKISSILRDKYNLGKTFNLDIISLTNYLYKIQQSGHISVVRTAGLDIVHLNTNWNYLECVNAYYDEINNSNIVIGER